MSYDKVECYIRTADGDEHNSTCWVFAETSRPININGLNLGVGLILKPNTPTNEADELAELMRKYVTHVNVWTE